jgi:hypothetical protein
LSDRRRGHVVVAIEGVKPGVEFGGIEDPPLPDLLAGSRDQLALTRKPRLALRRRFGRLLQRAASVPSVRMGNRHRFTSVPDNKARRPMSIGNFRAAPEALNRMML